MEGGWCSPWCSPAFEVLVVVVCVCVDLSLVAMIGTASMSPRCSSASKWGCVPHVMV